MRKQARRSFTVEIKHSITSGQSFIPSKQPRPQRKGKPRARPPSLAEALAPSVSDIARQAAAAEPRRILPSLITWAPLTPEPELEPPSEAPLPRVRRVVPTLGPDGAPRRRGRPRKIVPEGEPILSVAPPPVPSRIEDTAPAPAMPDTLVRPARAPRTDAAALPRSERWKRRLPRACW